MTSAVSFHVQGEPVAQGRPRVRVHEGMAHVYDPAKSRHYKKEVSVVARSVAISDMPWTGPVFVRIKAVYALPKSYHRKKHPVGWRVKATKPDVDNIAKTVLDAIQGILIKDDSQVVVLDVRKWTAPQGVEGSLDCYVEQYGEQP